MICDGYNEHHEINGEHFVIRPLTRFDRTLLGQTLDSVPELVGERIERQVVESRIVYGTCDSGETEFDVLRNLTFGIGRTEQEIEDEKNLFDGVRLVAEFPHFEKIDCDYCRKWWINPKSGTRVIQQQGEPTQHRPEGSKVACETVSGCPRGHWSNPVALSQKNEAAYRHYLLFQKSLPQDSICLKNARIIERALNVP